MTDLKQALGEVAGAAFAAEGLDPAFGRVSVSDRPDLADFQCNGALAAAKAARGNPREIAARIAERIKGDARLAGLEIAGPGFLNFRVSDEALATRAAEIAADPRAGAGCVERPRRVIVDYGGPNVAKPMHVGHLRASIIGESIKRLFRFRGDEVWGDAHFGDWGFQMGLLIAVIEEEAQSRNLDIAAVLDDIDLDRLSEIYPAASARVKSEPEFRDLARRRTAELQAGDPHYRAIWRRLHDISLAALKTDFAALDVNFDLWKGESDADPFIPAMVEDLKARGLAQPDQGAWIVRVARDGDKRELPPLLVVSSEGSSLYGATDLATIVERRQEQNPDLMLYVVDARQADHFEQVFRAADLAGYARREDLEHLGFGTMNGPDGKPFKTRAGGVLRLGDLIDMAREKARARLREADLGSALPPEEFEDIARKVAVAALKFADLSNFRGTSYVFDLDRFTSFEGRTGPYLLYQAVRIKSLLRRAEADAIAAGEIRIEAPAERDLGLTLDTFEAALADAYERRAPNLIAEHAYRLSQSFSKFYAACPVLVAPDASSRGSRLSLAATTLRQLEIALDLLGISVPERM